jgi:hypothetical protein
MKSMTICIALAGALSLGASALVPVADGQDVGGVPWRQLLVHDVSMYTAPRGPQDGAPGVSSLGFRVSEEVQGTALVAGMDGGKLGVFVGLNTPNDFIDAPYSDLRLEFVLTDGSSRVVSPAGGSGVAMLFQSPEGLPLSEIGSVALYVNKTAEWTR